jgi:hypothetical protein
VEPKQPSSAEQRNEADISTPDIDHPQNTGMKQTYQPETSTIRRPQERIQWIKKGGTTMNTKHQTLSTRWITFVAAVLVATGALFGTSIAAAEAIPAIVIGFDNASDLQTYFELPTASQGTWDVIDGQLVQTKRRVSVDPLGDESTQQFITLKGINLSDYILQFDYQVCTPLEAAEEYYYGKYVVFATNVPDGTTFSNTPANGGYGYVFSDPKSTGGNKKLELYALDKEPANNISPYSITSIKKLESFDVAGIHSIRIQKTGKDIQVFHKGPDRTEFVHLNTIDGDRQFVSPMTDPAMADQMMFETPGAMQIIAGTASCVWTTSSSHPPTSISMPSRERSRPASKHLPHQSLPPRKHPKRLRPATIRLP